MNAQELIIGHLLPIAATVVVLWGVYRLLFRNSNRLLFNRFFLLTSMLLALAMPLLGLLSGTELPQMATLKQNMFSGMMLSEVIVTPDGQPVLPEVTVNTNATPSRFSLWQVVGGIYLLGVGVMTLLFLFKLGKLVALIIRSPKRTMNGCTAVFTGREQGSFSFFRYAFFPNENVDPDIMRHEMSHISHHHSWDILFAEMMMILQWFNPFIYLYKKELQSLHEYQADRDVVATGVDKKNYMMLILQQCTAVDFSGMSNNFSLILTKKRIKMITRSEKAKGLWWRLLATLPVLAILMIANTKVTAQEMEAEKTAPVTEFRPETDGELKAYKISPSEDLLVKPTQSDNDSTFQVVKEELYRSLLDQAVNDSVFQIVDEMPQFPGGDQALMKYIAENIKYPQEAKDKEIAGRVFLAFVVEKDGSVSNVEVKRGIGGGCDDEAVRVVKAMPKWKPGKQKGEPVRVSYMLPVNFKLTDDIPMKSVKKTEANKPEMKPNADGVYQIVEEMPQFPSGETKMMEYIAKNINYPQEARDKGIEGRVFIGMVIEKDGSVSNVRVLRGIGGGCDEEAVRVISSMPKWKPGKVGGEPVPVSYMLPVNFKLQEKQSKKK